MEGYQAADWESAGHEAVVPRSSLNPLLHFSSVDAWFLPWEQRAGGFAQHGSCREGPHYLRYLVRETTDGTSFLRAVLEAMGGEALAAGILSPVRTYEATGLRTAHGGGIRANRSGHAAGARRAGPGATTGDGAGHLTCETWRPSGRT